MILVLFSHDILIKYILCENMTLYLLAVTLGSLNRLIFRRLAVATVADNTVLDIFSNWQLNIF